MKNIAVSFAPTASDMEEIARWLKEEMDAKEEGFYCNWNIIDAAFKRGRVGIISKGNDPIGFVTWYQDGHYARIDIAEIKPKARKRGYGKKLVDDLFQKLIVDGIAVVDLQCQPPSSETFWKAIGFIAFPSHQSFIGYNQKGGPYLYKTLEYPAPQNIEENHHADILELWPEEPSAFGPESYWSWQLQIDHQTGSLKAPVIFPAFSDWRLKYIRNGQSILEDRIKCFPKDILNGGFMVLRAIKEISEE